LKLGNKQWPHGQKDAKNADTKIKYCVKCKQCWEITLQNNFRKKQRKIIYYEDFPTYGKTKEQCDICKGENNVKNGIHSVLSRK